MLLLVSAFCSTQQCWIVLHIQFVIKSKQDVWNSSIEVTTGDLGPAATHSHCQPSCLLSTGHMNQGTPECQESPCSDIRQSQGWGWHKQPHAENAHCSVRYQTFGCLICLFGAVSPKSNQINNTCIVFPRITERLGFWKYLNDLSFLNPSWRQGHLSLH